MATFVEFGFTKSGGDFVYNDITNYVRSVSIQRGKSRDLERYNAGTVTVTLDNRTRVFDPRNTGSPFNGQILPAGGVRVVTDGVQVFVGLITDWNFDYDLNGDSIATLTGSDGFWQLANQNLTAQTPVAETSSARITRILNLPEVAWPAGKRKLDTGNATLGAYPISSGENALSYLQDVEASEPGRLFIDNQGNIVFKNSSATSVSYTSTVLRYNWCTNPSFETNTTGYTVTNGTIARSTAAFVRGTASLLMTPSTGLTARVYAPTDYQFATSGYFSVAIRAVTGTVNATVTAWDREPFGVERPQITVSQTVGTTFTTLSGPMNLNRRGSPQAYQSRVSIEISGGAAYIDTIYIGPDQSLLPYFDGAGTGETPPASTTFAHAWSGTANNSRSTQTRTTTSTAFSLITFSDTGVGLPYDTVQIAYGAENLYTRVTATRQGGALQTANATTEQATYGIRTVDFSNLLNSADPGALTVATNYLNLYYRPEYRIEAIRVNLRRLTVAQQQQVLNLDLDAGAQVNFTPNKIGAQIGVLGRIIGIEHDIQPLEHYITIRFGSLDYGSFANSLFILDSTTNGILNTNTLGV